MLVGIHIHRRGIVDPFSQKYINILQNNNIPYIILDVSDINFWVRLSECTHFIYHWGGISDQHQIANAIMPVIENELKIPVFPNYQTTWQQDDKIRQFYLMHVNGFPMIKSWVFWEKKQAKEWVKTAQFPIVFKLKNSAGSQDVVLVKNLPQAMRIIRIMFGRGARVGEGPGTLERKWKDFSIKRFISSKAHMYYRILRGFDKTYQWQLEKNYVYFQEFMPKNEFDTRVTIIGNRAFAFRRMNRPNDFRSSGSGLIDHDYTKIDINHVENAFKIAKHFNFQSMAFDFLYDRKGNSVFCEISYTFADWAVAKCSGYWDELLNWHEGNTWPQYCQLEDFLKIPLNRVDFDRQG